MIDQELPILYQIEECPHCHRVRKALNDAGQAYLAIPVPRKRDQRADLKKQTGQEGVPFFIDSRHDFSEGDTDKIISFIKKNYPAKKKFGLIDEDVENLRFETLKGLINVNHKLDESKRNQSKEKDKMEQIKLREKELARLLRAAEKAHGPYEKTLGHADVDWSVWYAKYILTQLCKSPKM